LSALDTSYLLSDTKQSEILWATLLPMLANILAEAVNEPKAGIGLYGAGAAAMGESIAEALGCQRLLVTDCRHIQPALEKEHRHNWPVFVQQPLKGNGLSFSRWLNEDQEKNHNAIAVLDWWQFLAKSFGSAWNMVQAPAGGCLPAETLQAVSKFVSAYLHNLMVRNMKLSEWYEQTGPWVPRLAKDVKQFLQSIDRRSGKVLQSLSLLRLHQEQGHASAFVELLSEFVRLRKLTVIPEGFQVPSAAALLKSSQGLFVPRLQLQLASAKRNIQLPGAERISAVLAQAGKLKAESPEGWTIDYDWWHDCHARRRAIVGNR
jgi:hypothetical protein